MRLRSLLVPLLLLSVVMGDGALGINEAHADAHLVINQPQTTRQIELNIHGSAYYGYSYVDDIHSYGYWGGYAIGPGIQMLFPVLKNGFIPSLNNAFYVGFFTDFLLHPNGVTGFSDYLFSFAIGPVAQWRFIILDMFQGGGLSAFANLGFGIWPWFYRAYGCNCTTLYGFPLIELGANLFFTHSFGLTFSFGYPSVKFGVTLAF